MTEQRKVQFDCNFVTVEGEEVGADDFSEAAFERGNDKRSQSGTLEPEESLDPFVNMFYVCTVADCSDCKELELL